MPLPAVIWGGIWAVGMISARIAVRQVAKRVLQAVAQRRSSRLAQQALAIAIEAGTLAPEDMTDIDDIYIRADQRANALAREMAAACAANPRECNECPANQGSPVPRNWNMSLRAREYQQFITGFPQRVEWNYNTTDFDGFWRSLCTLVEAKDRYSQFLKVEVSDGGIFTSPTLISVSAKSWWQGLDPMIFEAKTQRRTAIPSPPVMLQWHCSEIALTILLTKELSVIPIVPIYTPHPNANDPYAVYIQ